MENKETIFWCQIHLKYWSAFRNELCVGRPGWPGLFSYNLLSLFYGKIQFHQSEKQTGRKRRMLSFEAAAIDGAWRWKVVNGCECCHTLIDDRLLLEILFSRVFRCWIASLIPTSARWRRWWWWYRWCQWYPWHSHNLVIMLRLKNLWHDSLLLHRFLHVDYVQFLFSLPLQVHFVENQRNIKISSITKRERWEPEMNSVLYERKWIEVRNENVIALPAFLLPFVFVSFAHLSPILKLKFAFRY